MEFFIGYTLFCLIPIIMSGIIGLTNLIPFVQRIGQYRNIMLQIKSGVLASVAFAVMFGAYTAIWIEIRLDTALYLCQCSESPDYVHINQKEARSQKTQLRQELWLRSIAPGVNCFANQPDVCTMVDAITDQSPYDIPDWARFGLFSFAGMMAAIPVSVITWETTRQAFPVKDNVLEVN